MKSSRARKREGAVEIPFFSLDLPLRAFSYPPHEAQALRVLLARPLRADVSFSEHVHQIGISLL